MATDTKKREDSTVRLFTAWDDLKESAEWMAEGSVPRDDPKFDRLRRNYLQASALMAYGFVVFLALFAILVLFLLVVLLLGG